VGKVRVLHLPAGVRGAEHAPPSAVAHAGAELGNRWAIASAGVYINLCLGISLSACECVLPARAGRGGA